MPANTPLRAWRKRQIVEDPDRPGLRRSMRLLDVERLYGIAVSTWHGWEKAPGEHGFRRPDAANMHRLHVEITKGEIGPQDFYPTENWRQAMAGEAEMKAAAGG